MPGSAITSYRIEMSGAKCVCVDTYIFIFNSSTKGNRNKTHIENKMKNDNKAII